MGFAELEQIFEAVTTGLGQAPIVIDANDLLAAPAAVLRAWYIHAPVSTAYLRRPWRGHPLPAPE